MAFSFGVSNLAFVKLCFDDATEGRVVNLNAIK